MEKQRQEDANRNKQAAKEKALAQQKRAHKAKADKHKEVFGADYDDDDADMDQYYDMEDVRIYCVLYFVFIRWSGVNVGMISWAGWVDRGLTEYQPSTFKIHTQQEFM